MEIQELRIGNYVEYKKDIVGIGIIKALTSHEPQELIYQCSIDFIDSEEGLGSDLQFINPIPLTEEWLVKFGYKYKGKPIHIKDGLILMKYKNKWYIELGFCNPESFPYSVLVEYVHTFQNLIYALTGKELEIKLAH